MLPLAETILEVESTGNRADLLSVYGLARDVCAIYDVELAPPPGRDPERAGDEPVDITIEDYEGCPRYIGRLFRDVADRAVAALAARAADRRRACARSPTSSTSPTT